MYDLRLVALSRAILIVFIFVALAVPVVAQTALDLRKEIKKSIPDAQKEIVTLSEKGISPEKLTISKLDASVFFLNTTDEDEFSLEIDFGKNRVHCFSPNLDLSEDGVMRTKEPIRPKDFAIMCFPQAGNYAVRVIGLTKQKKTLGGEIIIVEPGAE
jgi:hypothetical protein